MHRFRPVLDASTDRYGGRLMAISPAALLPPGRVSLTTGHLLAEE